MKILKDAPLSIMTKIFGYGGRYFLSATALLGFPLTSPEILLPEDELWSRAADSLSRGEVIDLGMPKPQGEVLVSGRCFSHDGTPMEATTAAFSVGEIEKKLVVIGDRFWIDGASSRHSAPIPFTSMPLAWERSFGGPHYGPNPVGRGIGAQKDKDGVTVYPLPNLEDPRHPVAHPADRPAPAGFGPLGISWPDRLRNLGAFDDAWRQQAWPGFPADFDFSYFNVAPKDQQQKGFFRGDETFYTLHMTEKEPRRQGCLPGLRVRLFAMRKGTGDRRWLESKTGLDTVWLFPAVDLGVLIWHGTWETGDDEGSDVEEIMAVREPIAAAPGDAAGHEWRLRQGRKETEPSALLRQEAPAAPAARPMMPGEDPVAPGTAAAAAAAAAAAIAAAPAVFAWKAMAPPYPPSREMAPELGGLPNQERMPPPGATEEEIVSYYEELVARQNERLREWLQSIGIDPDNPPPLPEPSPDMAKSSLFVDAPPAEATAEEITSFYENAAKRGKDRLEEFLRSMGMDPDAAPPLPEPPPKAAVAELIAGLTAMPGNNGGLIAALKEMEGRRQAMEDEMSALAAQAAQGDQAPAPRRTPPEAAAGESQDEMHTATAEKRIEEIKRRLMENRDLSGLDLSGLDLGSLFLSGADLTGAKLEGANLAGQDLAGVVLTGALLSGATLSRANLSGVVMKGANAARTKFAAADLRGADLSGMDLHGADFSGADLSGADLSGSDLSGAILSQARGKKVQAAGALFIGADLSGADFSHAVFTAVDLSEANLVKAVFDGADLSAVWFSDADASGANLQGATLTAAKGEGKAVFRNARLSGAKLVNAYFEDADFSAADFSAADLTGATLTRCLMEQANLAAARAREADFTKSDLSGAKMGGINLMEGSLRKAGLTGVDLRQANLFAADFFKSKLGGARLEGANIKRTLLAGEDDQK